MFEDESIDLKITVIGGDYTSITDAWLAKDKNFDEQNHITNKFGNINLQTVGDLGNSGRGDFRFCIVKTNPKTDTDELVTLKNFTFTVWDLDERKEETGDGILVKERLIMNTAQAKSYRLFPSFAESEVNPICDDGSSVPPTDANGTTVDPAWTSCPGKDTIFRSSTFGNAGDNPDVVGVSELQRKRAISFLFEDASCWDFSFDHYCPVDQPGYTGTQKKCMGKRIPVETFCLPASLMRCTIIGSAKPLLPPRHPAPWPALP